MLFPIFTVHIFLCLLVDFSHSSQVTVFKGDELKPTRYYTKRDVHSKNRTYMDTSDNIRLLPSHHNAESQRKMKKIKKTPKRTIQKIIKKNKSKKRYYITKNMYTTTQPVTVSENKDFANEKATTQAVQRKNIHRNRKYSKQLPTYMRDPFKKYHSRSKRKTEEDRKYVILRDLDEAEFLSKEDGNDVVKVHVQNHW